MADLKPAWPVHDDPDDLVVWPDGTTCLRRELGEFGHMSDDYEIVPFDSPRWNELRQ